jgi:hypothetical protein
VRCWWGRRLRPSPLLLHSGRRFSLPTQLPTLSQTHTHTHIRRGLDAPAPSHLVNTLAHTRPLHLLPTIHALAGPNSFVPLFLGCTQSCALIHTPLQCNNPSLCLFPL